MAKVVYETPKELVGVVLSEKDVAAMLQVSVKTVNRRFKDGTIRAIRIGNKWRTLRTDVDKFLSQS
jgi:excisionase family DNA binding protein